MKYYIKKFPKFEYIWSVPNTFSGYARINSINEIIYFKNGVRDD